MKIQWGQRVVQIQATRSVRDMFANSTVVSSTAAFVMTILAPSVFTSVDTRGVSVTTIIIAPPKGSPAFAALEDMRLDEVRFPSSKTEGSPTRDAITLMSGEVFTWKTVDEAQVKSDLEISRLLADLPLGGRLNSRNVGEQSQVSFQPRPPPQQLRGLRIKANPLDESPLLPSTPLEAVALNSEEDSLSARAKRLVSQALRDRAPLNSKVMLSSTTGNKVVIQAGEGAPEAQSPLSESQPQVLAAAPPISGSSVDVGSSGVSDSAVRWLPSPNLPRSHPSRNITIAGSLELDGGLAYTGRNGELVVFYVVDGFVLDFAKVDLTTGDFQIDVAEPIGQIVAEVRDSDGQVMGRGDVLISTLSQVTPRKIQIERLSITPILRDSEVEVLSAYSTDTYKMKVEGARVAIDGIGELPSDDDGFMFIEDRLGPDSSYVVRAQAPNHWGTLLVGNNSDVNRMKLFSNRMMEALLNLQAGENSSRARQLGVIWGRVFVNGRPVEGAQVELAGRQSSSPIYFNQLMIPDRFSDSTSKNGVFSFIWVGPGLQQVRVKVNGRFVPAQIIPVESGNVSYVEFHVNPSIRAPIEIFDPLSPAKTLRASLNLADSEDQFIDIQGRGALELQQGNGLMTLEIDAGEAYEFTRFFAERRPNAIRIPLISRDFMSRLVARRRINLDSGKGIIVGIGVGEQFKVKIETQPGSEEPMIVYFDVKGNPVIGDTGPADGGFAIFNAPLGLQSVIVRMANTEKMLTRIAIVDETFLNVFNFKK